MDTDTPTHTQPAANSAAVSGVKEGDKVKKIPMCASLVEIFFLWKKLFDK